MITLLSPAKNMDETPLEHRLDVTQPRLKSRTQVLVDIAKTKSAQDLKDLMHISDNLAELNVARYQSFSKTGRSNSAKPAALLFNGDVYTGLDAPSLTEADLNYAQDHLRILSGLYGALRPLDAIQPYRLEMGIKLENPDGKNLYEFWGEDVSKILNKDLADHADATIVNLASNEYFKAVNKKTLTAPVINVAFKENKDGKSRVISFYAKKARGMMARWIVENRCDVASGLKDFSAEGYRFSAANSTDKLLTFTRKQPAPKS